MSSEKNEPTKRDVIAFIESQLSDMEAYGFAHRDSLVDGVMSLLSDQDRFARLDVVKHLTVGSDSDVYYQNVPLERYQEQLKEAQNNGK